MHFSKMPFVLSDSKYECDRFTAKQCSSAQIFFIGWRFKKRTKIIIVKFFTIELTHNENDDEQIRRLDLSGTDKRFVNK